GGAGPAGRAVPRPAQALAGTAGAQPARPGTRSRRLGPPRELPGDRPVTPEPRDGAASRRGARRPAAPGQRHAPRCRPRAGLPRLHLTASRGGDAGAGADEGPPRAVPPHRPRPGLPGARPQRRGGRPPRRHPGSLPCRRYAGGRGGAEPGPADLRPRRSTALRGQLRGGGTRPAVAHPARGARRSRRRGAARAAGRPAGHAHRRGPLATGGPHRAVRSGARPAPASWRRRPAVRRGGDRLPGTPARGGRAGSDRDVAALRRRHGERVPVDGGHAGV
ncbi:MAG: hypothetical protein AVDCRST_MAG06-133, partial [uncultured Nocardioides sp.]